MLMGMVIRIMGMRMLGYLFCMCLMMVTIMMSGPLKTMAKKNGSEIADIKQSAHGQYGFLFCGSSNFAKKIIHFEQSVT